MKQENRLIMNFRDLEFIIRLLYEGRGSQKQVLIILRETGPITQRELTERLGVRTGSSSEVIIKLERAGLLMRTPHPADRRTFDIYLTEAGLQQAEEAAAQRETRHREMFSCLSKEEQATLLALMEKLNADWTKRYHHAIQKAESL